MTNEHLTELAKFIVIAEACHRGTSYSWHILDWMSYKMRLKYPLIRKCDQIINLSSVVS